MRPLPQGRVPSDGFNTMGLILIFLKCCVKKETSCVRIQGKGANDILLSVRFIELIEITERVWSVVESCELNLHDGGPRGQCV